MEKEVLLKKRGTVFSSSLILSEILVKMASQLGKRMMKSKVFLDVTLHHAA